MSGLRTPRQHLTLTKRAARYFSATESRTQTGGKPAKRSAAGAALGSSESLYPPQVLAVANKALWPTETPSQKRDRAERNQVQRTRLRRADTSRAWLRREAWAEVEHLPYSERPRLPRAAMCGWTLGNAAVGVHGSSAEGAHFSGLERCSSPWACPTCTPIIRSEKAGEISAAVREAQARGWSVLFVTLTMRHKSSDALAVTLNAALEGWRDLLRGAPWQRQRKRYGIRGYVRSVETMWGHENGWHPHIHALLFLEAEPTADELAAFESWVYGRWSTAVTNQGGGMPNRLRGVDMRLADKYGQVLGQYLAKVQGETGSEAKRSDVGMEMARFDTKQSRGTGAGRRYAPFELLDAPKGVRASALWCEYYAATKGRKSIMWSRGLRELLEVGDERDDDEIINDALTSTRRINVGAELWRHRLAGNSELRARVLEAVELDRLDAAEHLVTGRYELAGEAWLDVATGEVIEPRRGAPLPIADAGDVSPDGEPVPLIESAYWWA